MILNYVINDDFDSETYLINKSITYTSFECCGNNCVDAVYMKEFIPSI